ncbi:hypothetical protein RHGRI_003878 [Rhododendron griersonianum]|uniref:Uncharacterized protein n=1 Tax=Rhododendron griersonianum TaxID=479676 RepID=A0AAV6L6V5_9ERIC|nr:hypothetical protein RHGRI_003878 [Rhododendron griersonianum]
MKLSHLPRRGLFHQIRNPNAKVIWQSFREIFVDSFHFDQGLVECRVEATIIEENLVKPVDEFRSNWIGAIQEMAVTPLLDLRCPFTHPPRHLPLIPEFSVDRLASSLLSSFPFSGAERGCSGQQIWRWWSLHPTILFRFWDRQVHGWFTAVRDPVLCSRWSMKSSSFHSQRWIDDVVLFIASSSPC